ncbi:MAG: MMPL family transporter, partial [Chloroflexi bacterium]|nr:MMPL family transporter [Chloroflexota bacterium]
MFAWLARAVLRAPWVVMGVWALAAALSLPLAPGAGTVLKSGGIGSGESEGARGLRLASEELGLPLSSVLVVYSSQGAPRADAPAFLDQVDRSLARVHSHPAVQEIVTYRTTQNQRLISPDGTTTYAVIGLTVHGAQAQRLMAELRSLVVPPDPPIQMWLTGGPAAYGDMELVSHEDLRRAEMTSFPIAFLVLLAIFGSLVAAGAPVLVGGVSVLITLALIALLGRVVEMSIFTLNISTMLGLGIGIDYSLFMVTRFREELRRTPSVEEA